MNIHAVGKFFFCVIAARRIAGQKEQERGAQRQRERERGVEEKKEMAREEQK